MIIPASLGVLGSVVAVRCTNRVMRGQISMYAELLRLRDDVRQLRRHQDRAAA
ncbi:hypothetical protein [Amycolatopsis sp. CA-126428]|uniref:hypothetical protein n=1 Tax=Amycolatopsis sp. CA-126428 TaxID=2073158 RepID=UPI0013049740|nr:hypothetical protein [Amycolatopsis sp. CA-126428]